MNIFSRHLSFCDCSISLLSLSPPFFISPPLQDSCVHSVFFPFLRNVYFSVSSSLRQFSHSSLSHYTGKRKQRIYLTFYQVFVSSLYPCVLQYLLLQYIPLFSFLITSTYVFISFPIFPPLDASYSHLKDHHSVPQSIRLFIP